MIKIGDKVIEINSIGSKWRKDNFKTISRKENYFILLIQKI